MSLLAVVYDEHCSSVFTPYLKSSSFGHLHIFLGSGSASSFRSLASVMELLKLRRLRQRKAGQMQQLSDDSQLLKVHFNVIFPCNHYSRKLPLLGMLSGISTATTAFLVYLAALSPAMIFNSKSTGSALSVGQPLVLGLAIFDKILAIFGRQIALHQKIGVVSAQLTENIYTLHFNGSGGRKFYTEVGTSYIESGNDPEIVELQHTARSGSAFYGFRANLQFY